MSYLKGLDQDKADPVDLADRVTRLSAIAPPVNPEMIRPDCPRCDDDHFIARPSNPDLLIPCPSCRPVQFEAWRAASLPPQVPDHIPAGALAYKD